MDTPDTRIATLLKHFLHSMPVAEENLVKNQIVTEKENWGYQELKEFLKSYYLIAYYVETSFGKDKFFIANSNNGEFDGNTKYQNIQDQFVGNFSKLKTEE